MKQLEVWIEVTKLKEDEFKCSVLYGKDKKSIFNAEDELKESACYLLRKCIRHKMSEQILLYKISTGEYVHETDIAREQDVCIVGLDSVEYAEDVLDFIDDVETGVDNLDVRAKLNVIYNDEVFSSDEFLEKYLDEDI